MKLIMTAIATLGAVTTFAGSALADVTISIRFGSSPSTNTYRTYDSYNSNIRHHTYHNPYHQNYNHHQNVNSRVIVREIVPSHNYGNSWNYPTAPSVVCPANFPAANQSVYNPYNVNLGGYNSYPTTNPSMIHNPYNVNLGDRYIVEQRIIRIR
jgi:hypothetical protein